MSELAKSNNKIMVIRVLNNLFICSFIKTKDSTISFTNILNILLFLKYLFAFYFICLYVCVCVHGARLGQKSSDPLELQTVVVHNVNSEKWMQDICKSLCHCRCSGTVRSFYRDITIKRIKMYVRKFRVHRNAVRGVLSSAFLIPRQCSWRWASCSIYVAHVVVSSKGIGTDLR